MHKVNKQAIAVGVVCGWEQTALADAMTMCLVHSVITGVASTGTAVPFSLGEQRNSSDATHAPLAESLTRATRPRREYFCSLTNDSTSPLSVVGAAPDVLVTLAHTNASAVHQTSTPTSTCEKRRWG